MIESVDDVLNVDPLGLLGSKNEVDQSDIFDLKDLPSKSRALTDFMAKRKPCKDFEKYKNQFVTVQQEIKESKRKLMRFDDRGDAIVEDNYYVLGGILLYLEKIYFDSEDKTVNGKRQRKDGRTRCVFENGTESNMLYRSLAKALYQGGKIVSQTEDQINSEFLDSLGIVKKEDKLAGTIYILKSLSENAEIQSIQHLYKIGFSTVPVEKRIANAENEPTYLMSPVKKMAVFDAYNMTAQKFEQLIHRFFSEVCVDLNVADNKGKMHQPREWFVVPYDVIVQAINLLENGQIIHYRYDIQLKEIVVL
ncbi:MAG: GIY-YIG nuclease family protein [Methylococcales bacterium]|nr:GIY-YIG nuclease family protein [Methylococcales bacterium]